MFRFERRELEMIHRNVLRILREIGVEIGHPLILDALAAIGAQVDGTASRARFPEAVVEEFIASCPRVDWETRQPGLMARASFYWGKYEDPDTGELGPIDERRVREYFALARALPNIDGWFMTGCPWCPSPELSPLYERFYCWRYGAEPSGILYPLQMAPRLKELYSAYAALKGKTLPEVFEGGVYMMSPLRLSAEEAAQFVWWWQQGCRVGVSHMCTGGLTAPVTPAGLVATNIAEEIAIALLNKACYGTTALRFFAMVANVDMRNMMRPYGRPEMIVANALVAALARYYGVGCFTQSGSSDAKVPSCEAGAQKALSAALALASGADAMIDAGTLSIDEVFSPIQMILDDELTGAIRHTLRPVVVSEETLGFEALAELAPGELIAAHPHTARHFREVSWEPTVWSREMLAGWEATGRKTDVDRARERYHALVDGAPPFALLTTAEEAGLLRVMEAPGGDDSTRAVVRDRGSLLGRLSGDR
jgi:trimethylamine---corrinoid protein Co-methyltransferase